MDSAAGTCVDGRDKNYQAVFALKGKPLNTFSMAVHKIEANEELADLSSVLRCIPGPNGDTTKCKFTKIIVLADADRDGLHISLLLTTFFQQHHPKLLEEGRVFIGIAPAYRVIKAGQDPLYFANDTALNQFYVSVIEKGLTINSAGKKLTTEKSKLSAISAIREYVETLEAICKHIVVDPVLFEVGMVYPYAPTAKKLFDHSDFDHRLTEESTAEAVSLNGYITIDNNNEFISINFVERDTIVACVEKMRELLTKVLESEYSFVGKNGAEISDSMSYYRNFKNILDIATKQNFKITKFKGLGESEPDELWATTLDPDRRTLIQLSNDDLAQETVEMFMGKNRDGRKAFLLEVFDRIDIEDLDV